MCPAQRWHHVVRLWKSHMLGTCKMPIVIWRAERKGSVVLRLLGWWVVSSASSDTFWAFVWQFASESRHLCVDNRHLIKKTQYVDDDDRVDEWEVFFPFVSRSLVFMCTNVFLRQIEQRNSGEKLVEVKGKCGDQPFASAASKAYFRNCME